jgi:hypothetical protein
MGSVVVDNASSDGSERAALRSRESHAMREPDVDLLPV